MLDMCGVHAAWLRAEHSPEQDLKLLSSLSIGEAVDRVPLVVLPDRVARHSQSAIVMEGVNIVEYETAHAVGQHYYAVRKFAVEQRSGCLATSASHVFG